MKVSINVAISALVIVAGVYIVFQDDEPTMSVDEQLEKTKSALDSELDQGGDPLSNTNSTLRTLVARDIQRKDSISALETQIKTLQDSLDRERRNNASNNNDDKYHTLEQKYLGLMGEIEALKNTPPPFEAPSQVPKSVAGGAPIIEPIETNEGTENVLIEQFKQPANQWLNETISVEVEPISSATQVSNGTFTVEQKDAVIVINEKTGAQERQYPTLFLAEGNSASTPLDDFTNTIDTESQNEQSLVPIYTVPANSTLFGSVGMSALLGRVPINNEVSNPFRFKVLVGNDNLATNGLYIPNIQSMVASGEAYGDFTLECVRGNLDKITFTFNDGTVRQIIGEVNENNIRESLGWISDKDGVPCIPGQYITNFPSYMAKQAALTGASSFAASLANSAVTTSTNADGVTVEVVQDSLQKAAGDGITNGTDEISKWHAERQQSAFDVVFVETGTPLVLNIEQSLHIDYELDGRKLYHQANAEEYLQW
ncbi:hypothetical protein VTH8203_00849 [Vibrio thalassae]|uniref:Bacterial conjugation TrbI-like protein n=1 Tax=Vibrio thalassae TaxID=1243014 RepID=A0A240EEY0_9VIBR|nr:TIGR03752 family integrating conjugative element protein [Vibrio thalassae]SNX47248.1 hypothetical protein VTH8203_00849 [Vibrio thalassae]